MASDDRNLQYEEYKAEFNTLREEMDALRIGASFKPLMAYENWVRYRPSKRRSIVGNARRDNKLAIDRANKAAAEAAAASEAGSSQARPSVRDRSNTRSPFAMLTTRCLAQRAGTLAGLARWWGVARATASSLMAAVMQVLPSISPAHILAKFGAPPDPTKPSEVFRSEFNRKASSCARVWVGGCLSRVAHPVRVSGPVCVGLARLRGFQCKNLAVGQHHTARERRLSSDAPEPASRRSGPGRMEKGG